LLSRVFDHTDHRYYRGFRLLTLGWSDGNSFLPVSCTLLSSSKEKNRLVPMRTDLDRRTNGAKRRREAICKRRGCAEILASVMVEIGKDDLGVPVPAKIVFARDRRVKKWLALLSTDTALGNEEIITTHKR